MFPIAEADNSDFRELWQFYENIYLADTEKYALKRLRLRLPFIPLPILTRIVDEAHSIFSSEPILRRESGEYVVVGDLNGNILDLMRVLQNHGSPEEQKYVILGDFVNVGEFSIQTMTVIFLMKVLWPTNVIVLRGHDEFAETCETGGFKAEYEMFYGKNNTGYERIMKAFSMMPLAAVINNKAFCVSGGIGRDSLNIEAIEEIERPIDSFDKKIVSDLVWSEPTTLLPMFLPASRKFGTLFGIQAAELFERKTSIPEIVRGFKPVDNGCETMLNGRVITVFTASRYCGGKNRSGCYIITPTETETVSYTPLETVKKESVTFVTSSSDKKFIIEKGETLESQFRNLSQQLMPACNGLKLSSAQIGTAKKSQMLKPECHSASRRQTLCMKNPRQLVVPRIQKMTLDL